MGANACCQQPEQPTEELIQKGQATSEWVERVNEEEPPEIATIVTVESSPEDSVAKPAVEAEPADNTSCILVSRGGQDLKVKLDKAPFGMTFQNKLPIVITKVIDGNGAKAAVVKVGDIVKAIEGKQIDGMEFAAVKAELYKLASKLA